MAVAVPMVVGLGRAAAEAKLFSLNLRHIGKFPFAATGDGSATAQSPAAGTLVPTYSIVTVTYPSPLGPLDDTGVEGPTLPAGTYDGQIKSVMVGNPWGSGQGAWIDFSTVMDGGPVMFTGVLYFEHVVNPGPATHAHGVDEARRNAGHCAKGIHPQSQRTRSDNQRRIRSEHSTSSSLSGWLEPLEPLEPPEPT